MDLVAASGRVRPISTSPLAIFFVTCAGGLIASSRATGLGFSYNMGITFFGGMGPVIMAWLGGLVGDLAPAYYLTVVCLVSIGALCTVR